MKFTNVERQSIKKVGMVLFSPFFHEKHGYGGYLPEEFIFLELHSESVSPDRSFSIFLALKSVRKYIKFPTSGFWGSKIVKCLARPSAVEYCAAQKRQTTVLKWPIGYTSQYLLHLHQKCRSLKKNNISAKRPDRMANTWDMEKWHKVPVTYSIKSPEIISSRSVDAGTSK